MLVAMLKEYPNASAAGSLQHGFTFGFSLGFNGPRISRFSDCLKSAKALPHIVMDKISKERSLGRIEGPFDTPPFANLQCSPIGLVPKHEPNSYRMIHHLSFPAGESVNDFINRDECVVHYASFDEAVNIVRNMGRGAWLAKSDIKSAFRLLPVAPSDYELLGFTFQGKYYYDKCLPMGCSISCALFEKFSTFLEFQIRKVTDSSAITHYLDDFFFAHESHEGCKVIMEGFSKMCESLGVPLAIEKTVGPQQALTYLGLEIDSQMMQVRVPLDKVIALKNKLHRVLAKHKVEVQSIVGTLNFVCRAVAPGRAFLRRLISLTHGLTKSYHKVRLSKGAKQDLSMWLEFLSHFNGVSAFSNCGWESNHTLDLYTDSAATIGFGAYFRGQWVQGRWQTSVLSNPPSIALLEFYPVVVAVKCWAEQLVNRKVLFHSDNMAVVHIINGQTSQCPKIMQLLRIFVLTCLRFNISFKAVHVPGVLNNIADSLSRFQVERFHAAAPQAVCHMTPLPLLPQVW